MIRYSLTCEKGHDFESWFKNSAEFDRQQSKRELICPSCGSHKVEKAIMAPSLGSSAAKGDGLPVAAGEKVLAALDPRRTALMEALREIRKSVTDQAENVGPRFPEEARKIHYGEVEPRGIFGEASVEEAVALAEEGVDFHPLPALPEDRN